MDKKPKASGAKKKERPKKAKDEKQFERFIETAQTLGVINDGNKQFERAFASILRESGKKTPSCK